MYKTLSSIRSQWRDARKSHHMDIFKGSDFHSKQFGGWFVGESYLYTDSNKDSNTR